MSIIARKGFFRRIADALIDLVRSKPVAPPPLSGPLPPELVPPPPEEFPPPPSMVPVPPEESGIPPGPEDELEGYEKVVYSEGFVDYDTFNATGEFIVTDEYAAQLIWGGWFDLDVTPDDRMSARQEYFDYTDTESRDFDWYDWRDWYGSQSSTAA